VDEVTPATGGRMSGTLYLGTSGFAYDHWVGVLYPKAMRQADWLEHYCRQFATVEINASYYHMPRAAVSAAWSERTPGDFSFTMKLNGELTHRRRLVDCAGPLAEYMAAVAPLGEKLGPVLVQLPPSFAADLPRLESFLELCPPDGRWAVEFRHKSWFCEECYAILRARNVALVAHDFKPEVPDLATADWVYVRLHGPGQDFIASYPEKALRRRAKEISVRLAGGLDVYVYFNNDAHGHAVRNARRLAELMPEELRPPVLHVPRAPQTGETPDDPQLRLFPGDPGPTQPGKCP